MKTFTSTVEYIRQSFDYMGMLRHIEKCGRICYKSTPKDDNPQKFIKQLISRGHLSPLEHGTVYLVLDPLYKSQHDLIEFFKLNKYSVVNFDNSRYAYVTTNYRVLIENGKGNALEHMTSPMPMHEKRHTFLIHSDIGLSREGNRHRTFSICEQSTRYCNFSKERFSGELEFMEPSWWNIRGRFNRFLAKLGLRISEWVYMKLIHRGCSPQEARMVLPLATGTWYVYTAFEKDWEHFLELRCAAGAHPDMRVLAESIRSVIESIK